MSFIFLYGRPGSGKTTLATSMTKLGYKVKIVDVDNKASDMININQLINQKKIVIISLSSTLTESSLRDRITHITAGAKGFSLAPPTRQPQGYLEFADIIDSLAKLRVEGKKDPDGCDVLVAPDSLTTLLEHLKRLIMFLSKKGKFEFDEWAAWLSNLEELFHSLQSFCGMYKHVIVTAHEMTEVDNDTGRVTGIYPLIEGSMRYKVGDYFNEIYHCVVNVPKEGKPEYYVETRSVNKAEARTSRNLDTLEDSDFITLFKEELVPHKVKEVYNGKKK